MALTNGQRRPLRRGENKAPSVPRTFGPRPELRAPPALPNRPRPANSRTDNFTENLRQMQLSEATTSTRTETSISSKSPEESELPPEFQPATASGQKFFGRFFGQTDPSQWYSGQLPPFHQDDYEHIGGSGGPAGPNHEVMQA